MISLFNETLIGTALGVILLGVIANLLSDYIRKK